MADQVSIGNTMFYNPRPEGEQVAKQVTEEQNQNDEQGGEPVLAC